MSGLFLHKVSISTIQHDDIAYFTSAHYSKHNRKHFHVYQYTVLQLQLWSPPLLFLVPQPAPITTIQQHSCDTITAVISLSFLVPQPAPQQLYNKQ